MKLPSQYKIGDKVAIVSLEELTDLLSVYGNPDKLRIRELRQIADRICTILWLPSDTNDGWDGQIPVQIENGSVYKLPFASLVDIPEGFSYVEEPDELEAEVLVTRDKASEEYLVEQVAAETIQATYRYIITI